MKRITRAECIGQMRKWLVEQLEGGEDTLCDVASRHQVFCRGFDRFTTPELRRRFAWLAHDPYLTREQLLLRVRDWIHAREFVLELPTACDLMACEKDLCRGWEEFGDEKLSASYQEMFGEPVELVAERSP